MNLTEEQYNLMQGKVKTKKYKNKSTKATIDGKETTFDSGKEKTRYNKLKLRELAGEISSLKRQVKFTLIPAQYAEVNDKRTCIEKSVSYYADFTYIENGKLVVEDVKSKVTKSLPAYILKRKMMLYFHSIQIKEV